jgi:hypothetical protein
MGICALMTMPHGILPNIDIPIVRFNASTAPIYQLALSSDSL